MSVYENAAKSYQIEVEHEAARLIERGFAPWDAMRRAKEIVQSRRAAQAREEDRKKPRTLPR